MKVFCFKHLDLSAHNYPSSELWWECTHLQQATLVLREAIVVAAFYLVYRRVNAFCRWLYRFVTSTTSFSMKYAPTASCTHSSTENDL